VVEIAGMPPGNASHCGVKRVSLMGAYPRDQPSPASHCASPSARFFKLRGKKWWSVQPPIGVARGSSRTCSYNRTAAVIDDKASLSAPPGGEPARFERRSNA